MTDDIRDPGMIEHAPSCHLQHGLGGRCTCGASDRVRPDIRVPVNPHFDGASLRPTPQRPDSLLPSWLSDLLGVGPGRRSDYVLNPSPAPGPLSIPTPQLDRARTDGGATHRLGTDAILRETVTTAVMRAARELATIDARMQERLPSPPSGYHWKREIEDETNFSTNSYRMRLVYRLEADS